MLPIIAKRLILSHYSAFSVGLLWGCSPSTDAQPHTNQPVGSGGNTSVTSAGAQTSSGGGNATPTTNGSGGATGLTGINVSKAGDCGRQDFEVAQKPANVLLVLDRSASMVEDSTPTKWAIVVPTLKSVVSATNASISWGLKVFPVGTASQCTAATAPLGVVVPVAPSNASAVNTAIDSTQPTGNGTPTASALNEAIKDLQAVSNNDPKYILLATDGEPSCSTALAGGTDSTNARLQAITAAGEAFKAGFPTFVVGITTPDKQSALDSLNSMATAGGKPRQDPNPLSAKYYIASTAGELENAMKTITSTVATCTFALSSEPPNKDLVNVFVGPDPVSRDRSGVDGWQYSPPTSNTIQLYGSACDKIRSLGAQSVNVVFACDTDIIY